MDLGNKLVERDRIARLALPQRHHRPAVSLELGDLSRVPFDVALQLVRPEFDPAFRQAGVCAARVTMPEAAVNEDCQLGAPEDDVGPASQFLRLEAVS